MKWAVFTVSSQKKSGRVKSVAGAWREKNVSLTYVYMTCKSFNAPTTHRRAQKKIARPTTTIQRGPTNTLNYSHTQIQLFLQRIHSLTCCSSKQEFFYDISGKSAIFAVCSTSCLKGIIFFFYRKCDVSGKKRGLLLFATCEKKWIFLFFALNIFLRFNIMKVNN